VSSQLCSLRLSLCGSSCVFVAVRRLACDVGVVVRSPVCGVCVAAHGVVVAVRRAACGVIVVLREPASVWLSY
jgi:hypothetical protein